MTDVGKDVVAGSPAAKLLDNTLDTIFAAPGRIYNQHKLTVSPTDGVKETAKALVDVAAVVKPAVPGVK